jgi:hypothetical protein
MRFHVLGLCTAGVLIASTLWAADDPLLGTWKLNPAKSQFTGQSIKFENVGSGMIRFSTAGLSYTFKMDGVERPAIYGYTASWKKVDDRHWEAANKLNGKLDNTDYFTLSTDGKTLTDVTKGTRPDGVSFEDTTVYKRESGSGGLFGTWRSTEVKISAPSAVAYSASDGGALTFMILDYKASWTGQPDGSDHPFTGENLPKGLTLAFKRSGPRTLEFVTKIDGKPIYRGTNSVSSDGKTLTMRGRPVAVDEPYTAVYDRQ